MRQLDLFGFDSEPQPVAPSQRKKTVTVVPAPVPAPASAPDSNTLVFADDKIGIKIKLKREVSVVNDTTSDPSVPGLEDEQPESETEADNTLLQQLTLEDAIREATTENQEPEAIDITDAIDQQQNQHHDIAIEEAVEAADMAGSGELLAPEQALVEEQVQPEVQEETVSTANVAPEEEPIITGQPHALKLVKPAVITIEEEEVKKDAEPVVLSRPFLARPSVIEISNDAPEEFPKQELDQEQDQELAETPSHQKEEITAQATEINNKEDEPDEIVEAPAAETIEEVLITPDNAEAAANENETSNAGIEQEESFSAIVEEAAAKQQQPAKIKAPKLQSSREPVAPKKRGRKSFKEIDAESDLIQLPDDEALFEKQYYPISVVAGWFNVNASLLRFWENEFDILKPRKNRKGDRLFRPEDVKNLQVIYYLLRQRKFTIEGAKEYLKTNKKKADTNTQLIQSLNKLRGFLLEFKANIQA